MRPLPRRLFAVASAVALTAGLLSVSTAPAAEAAGPTPTSKVEKRRSKAVKTPKLTWYSCYGYAKCATVKVPLDYDKPKGKKVELALLKVPATNQKKKIGTLFVNPGGPGGSGTDLAYVSRDFLSAERDRPVRCRRLRPSGRRLQRQRRGASPSAAAERSPVLEHAELGGLPVRRRAGKGLHQGL